MTEHLLKMQFKYFNFELNYRKDLLESKAINNKFIFYNNFKKFLFFTYWYKDSYFSRE